MLAADTSFCSPSIKACSQTTKSDKVNEWSGACSDWWEWDLPLRLPDWQKPPRGDDACLGATLPATIVTIDWWIWRVFYVHVNCWLDKSGHRNCIILVAECERSCLSFLGACFKISGCCVITVHGSGCCVVRGFEMAVYVTLVHVWIPEILSSPSHSWYERLRLLTLLFLWPARFHSLTTRMGHKSANFMPISRRSLSKRIGLSIQAAPRLIR